MRTYLKAIGKISETGRGSARQMRSDRNHCDNTRLACKRLVFNDFSVVRMTVYTLLAVAGVVVL